MKVEIISKECIRPSSPTPQHLRTYKLSLLDQFIPPVYTPMVLFYPIDDDDQSAIRKDGLAAIEKRSKLLKESLSQTLSGFYPLAGKIKDSLSIDCTDEGVYYVEARVKSNLSEFLNQPDLSLIKKCLPSSDPTWNEPVEGAHVAMVQTNVFDCGGIVIGVYVTHMVADGVAFSTFLKSWGATARGCCDGVISPDYTTVPSLFPQNDSFPKELTAMAVLYPYLRIGKSIMRRFVFDSSALATMKAKASSLLVQNPTRVEVVSALIWKGAMAAFKANSSSGTQKPSLMTHAVNLRRRAGPPFSEFTMGNLLGSAVAKCTAETETGLEKETTTELCHLVHKLRQAITKVNNGFLKTLSEGDQGVLNYCEGVRDNAPNSNEGVDFLTFTSWINFGLYEIDFGWGKPMWATSGGSSCDEQAAASVFMNLVILKETRWGNGIEAWVNLDQQDMAILECNEELLAFASLDPSPLQSGR